MGSWRDKLFLFVNYEQEYIPQSADADQTVLTDGGASRASSAIRRRPASSAPPTCCSIAAPNGFRDTLDPTLAALLAKQHERAALWRGDEPRNNLRTEILSWLEPQKQINYYPTARLDYQITPNLSWMGSWNLYRPGRAGPARLAVSRLSRSSSTRSSSGWWMCLHRPELDDQSEHAQRVPLRRSA